MKRLRVPVGAKDDLPKDYAVKRAVRGRVMGLFETFGYMEMSSPTVEYADVFLAAGAGTGDIRALLSGGGSMLALKPDMTPVIARVAATSFRNFSSRDEDAAPLRLSYFERLFRPAARFQGKLKEFTQAGIELLGEGGAEADAETAALCVLALEACGLKDFKVYIGEAGLFEELLKAAGIGGNDGERLKELVLNRGFAEFEEAASVLCRDRAMLGLLKRLPFLKGGAEILDEVLEASGGRVGASRLSALRMALELYGERVIERVAFDLSLVGAFDYYTGIIFRAYANGSGAAIAEGGRYDGLSERFGASHAAVGFGISVDSLTDALSAQGIGITEEKPKTLLAYETSYAKAAIYAAQSLRALGDIVIVAPPAGKDAAVTAASLTPGRGGEDAAVTAASVCGCAGVIFFCDAGVVLIDMVSKERTVKRLEDFL